LALSDTAVEPGTLTRRLNHVELIYRPGERELAFRLFELLGCKPVDRGGVFLSSLVDPSVPDFQNNVFYASEVTPEQWRLEQALAGALGGTDELGLAGSAYLDRLQREPQRSFHFGVRYLDKTALDETVERVRHAGDHEPGLAGRVKVSGVYYPGDPDSYTDTMVQAFVRTDIVAAGLLAFGQHIELQWHVPVAP